MKGKITVEAELNTSDITLQPTSENTDEVVMIDGDGELYKTTKEDFLGDISTEFTIPTVTKTTAASGDYFIGIDSAGQLYKITKAYLLAGLVRETEEEEETPTTEGDDFEMRTIISRGSNWVLGTRGSSSSDRSVTTWTSLNTSESDTGVLKIGYITTKTLLHVMFAGGGGTNGNLKLIKIKKKSDDSLLLDTHLGTVMGTNNDNMVYCTIDTSTFSNIEVYFELTDNDSGSGWSWFAFCPDVFVE